MILDRLLRDVEYRQVNIHKEGEELTDLHTFDVKDIKIDSRKVEEGDAFVCIKGAEADGHDYALAAVKAGAKALVVEDEAKVMNKLIAENVSFKDLVLVQTMDSKKAFAKMSAAYFGHPSRKLKTVALTGTKGKTSTTFMIKNILEKAGMKVGVIGTMGFFVGDYHEHLVNTTPDSYTIHRFFKKMLDEGCDAAVMEVSSQALMLGRTEGIVFDEAVFTNLSPDHIGDNEHKDLEDYIYWKSALFEQCKHGIFNMDDECFPRMAKHDGVTCDVTTFGKNEKADICCAEMEYVSKAGFIGIDMKLKGKVNDEFKISSPGEFSAYNAMAAIAVANSFGVSDECMKAALEDFHVRGRVEAVKVSDRFTLMIDYAHNAMSMESLLNTIKAYNPKRIVSLFGCGGNRSKLRRFEMGEISGKLADFSILTADNSRFEDVNDIIADIEVGMKKTTGEYIIIPDRKEAIKYSIENAKDGDIVLLLGKGHEDYQEIEGVRYPFDERDIIADIMVELKKKGFK